MCSTECRSSSALMFEAVAKIYLGMHHDNDGPNGLISLLEVIQDCGTTTYTQCSPVTTMYPLYINFHSGYEI